MQRKLAELFVNTKTSSIQTRMSASPTQRVLSTWCAGIDSNSESFIAGAVYRLANIGGASEASAIRLDCCSLEQTVTPDALLDNEPELDSKGRPSRYLLLCYGSGWFIDQPPFC